MEALPRKFRYTDLAQLDSELRWELIDGRPYALPSPSYLHQAILREFTVALTLHFRGTPCQVLQSPFDVRFSEFDAVQPDLLVSCGYRLRSGFHEGAPDLVVEVLSPSTQRHDRVRKLNLYAAMGVPEYWLVTPHPFLVEVLSNEGGTFRVSGNYASDTLRSPRFSELSLSLLELVALLPQQPDIADEVREYCVVKR
jgi:Uma2 family endonuclease